jgi:hypothetical protein
MKFQGTAGAKKGPENGSIAAASAAAFWPSCETVFATVFVAGTGCAQLLDFGGATAMLRERREEAPPCCSRRMQSANVGVARAKQS